MQKLVFINADGTEIDLTSGAFGITEWEGFSSVDLNLQTQQVPFYDGSVYLDGLLGEREISVTLAMQDNNNLERRYELRRQLISVLNPKLGEGILIYTNDYISKRIKAVPQVPVFENHNSNDSGTPKASLSWTCPSPYWEDLEETEVELSNGIRKTITNEGDNSAQIKIKLYTENAKNPKIENITNNKSIEYKGTTETDIQINTGIGEKSVGNINTKFLLSNLGVDLYKIRYYKNTFIAVGKNGTIIISEDGNKLSVVDSGITTELNNICYSEKLDLFVVVGDGGTIITSSDLHEWEVQTSGTNEDLNGCIYSEEKETFYVVGYNGILATSQDGTTWSAQTVIADNYYLNNIIYAKGKFIATGNTDSGYRTYISTDSLNWNVISDLNANNLSVLLYSEDKDIFVALGYAGAYYSEDGENWEQGIVHSNDAVFNDVAYIKSRHQFIASTRTSGDFFYSVNGINWFPFGSNTYYQYSFAFAEDKGIAMTCGRTSKLKTSEDFITWINLVSNIENSTPLYSEFKNTIKYFDNVNYFVGSVGDGYGYVSENGNLWKWQTGYSDIFRRPFNDIIFAKNYFIIIQYVRAESKSYIYKSEDGKTWTKSYEISGVILEKISYSERLDLFVVVGSAGIILTSSNLQDWTQQTSGTNEDLKSVIYSEVSDLFITVGEAGVILVSSDSEVWTLQTSGTNENLNKLAESEDKIVIVGNNGVVLNSLNGIGYNLLDLDLGSSLQSVYYSKKQGKFIIVGFGGYILLSSDGEDWETIFSTQNIDFEDVVFSEKLNKYVIVGKNIILISEENSSGNLINMLSADSDMTLNLEVGKNIFLLNTEEGNVKAVITYRQKYIGV